jgi:hypothetical protein
MRHMIGDTKAAFDDLGHTGARPDGPTKAEGFGPLVEQVGQLGQLCSGQARRAPARLPAAQGRNTVGVRATKPFADGTLRAPQRIGDLLLVPSLLMELPATQAAPFAPIGGGGRCYRFHTIVSQQVLNLGMRNLCTDQ